MPPLFDVAVAGGGPSGTAAAIALAHAGARVVLLERSEYATMRYGETLPPRARLPLLRLGVWEAFLRQGHAPSPAIVSVWGGDAPHETHFICNAHGHGWHIDRRRLDEGLAVAAEEAGACVRRGARVVSCQPCGAVPWRVEFTGAAGDGSVEADFFVDATGRRSGLARAQRVQRISYDRLVGIVCVFSDSCRTHQEDRRTLAARGESLAAFDGRCIPAGGVAPRSHTPGMLGRRALPAGRLARLGAAPDFHHGLLVEAVASGWWYSARLPDSRVVAAYMTDTDILSTPKRRLRAHYQQRLDDAPHTLSRINHLTADGEVVVMPANSSRLERVTGANWLAVGDAAMAVDPLSSQGIYRALESGIAAAGAIASNAADKAHAIRQYERRVRLAFDAYLRKRLTYYRSETRWPRSEFWTRRQS